MRPRLNVPDTYYLELYALLAVCWAAGRVIETQLARVRSAAHADGYEAGYEDGHAAACEAVGENGL